MEEDNRSGTTLASANLESSCGFELTRSNSGDSSLTSENCKDILHQSFSDNCMNWTNEEHNRYLDYLEMSFVKQLHGSMGLLAWCTGQSDRRPSQKQLADLDRTSEQFTVLHDSQYPKINFEKDQSRSHTAAADSVDALKGPWTQCLRQASKDSTASAEFQECDEFHGEEKHLKGKRTSCEPASCSEQKHSCYSRCQDPVGSNNEGTGQNFVDEDHEENPSIVSRPKRLKTAGGDTSNKDQVVPCSMAYGGFLPVIQH